MQFEQERLDELRLDQWRRHLHDRLVGEHELALGDRPYLAREPQRGEQRQERLVEHAERAQVVEGGVVEVEAFEVVERGIQAAGDEVAALGREMPGEQVEGGGLVETVRVVARRHRQLVQVDEQRGVGVVDPAHGRRPFRRA